MLEGAEKPKTGGKIPPLLGYACWGQQMQTVSASIRRELAWAQDYYAWLIRED